MKKTLGLFFSVFPFLAFAQTRERLPCIDKKFSIVVHIVMDNSPAPGITLTKIQENIDSLSNRFAAICVSFEICEFKYIHNSYYDVVKNENWKEMQALYNVNNRINLYYVLDIQKPAGAAGFAGLGCITNLKSEGVVLKKSSGKKTMLHEFGHYFGLEHTFEGNGAELVDGSNCSTQGDKICDTPSDPFVEGDDAKTYVDANCTFISMKKDANGNYYNPIVGNTMSYYPDNCHCGFTHDQYLKMAKTYLSKKGMW